MNDELNEPPLISPLEVEKAIKLTYILSVLNSVYIALTTGVFIIGFALKLGATNAQIGLMTTIPMLCVVIQLASSWLVQRGISRRLLSICLSIPYSASWLLLIAIPYVLPDPAASNQRVWLMIGILTAGALLSHAYINARASWIADMVPPSRLGEFFGKLIMYSNILIIVSSIAGGALLDHLNRGGIGGFSWILVTATVAGLTKSMLLFPQADVPIKSHKSGPGIGPIIREAFRNRPLVSVMIYSIVWSMQTIAAPFVSTYLLRDVGAQFLQVAMVGAVPILMIVLSSSFWGRMVDRFGCRPVIVACTAMVVPAPLIWIWVTTPESVYYLLAPVLITSGFALAGIAVALNALVFNVIPSAGRSVHLAVYSICVLLIAAPLPAIGGYLPKMLHTIGIEADLRSTFYAAQLFALIAFFMARRIQEPSSRPTSDMMREMPVLSKIKRRSRMK